MHDFWEFLKNLPVAIAGLFLGGFLFFLGIHDKPLIIGGIDLQLTENLTRISSSIVGLLIIITGFIIAVRLKRIEIQSNVSTKSKRVSKQSIEAQDFFSTVTDRAESFKEMVQGATQLYILSITAVNILNQHHEIFEDLGRRNCKVRFLFLNPICEISKWIYGGNPKVFENNVNRTVQTLNKLKPIFGSNLQIRTIEYAPPMGIILVWKGRALTRKPFAHVQLYFLRGAIGANRPIFKVGYRDKWFQTFNKEFDKLWEEGKDWDTSEISNTRSTEEDKGQVNE